MDETQKKAAPKNRPRGFKTTGRAKNPSTSSTSRALKQSQHKSGSDLHELYKQNLELEKKIRVERKRGIELQRAVEKCRIKGWWEVPVEQLSLEELKLHKSKFEELSKKLFQSMEDRAIDSHGNNSDPRTDS